MENQVVTDSVVIPCYNGAKYVAEALRSVLGQPDWDRGRMEIIVVDDGSTDETLAEVSGVGSGVVLLQQNHQGAGVTRNRGAAEAKGEWLHFLDADDLWPEGRLDILHRLTRENPETEMAMGRVEYFVSPDLPQALRERAALPPRPMPGLLPGGVMVRRRIFEDSGGFDPQWKAGEFMDWILRVRQSGIKIMESQSVILRRRVHEANMGKSARENFGREYLRIIHAARKREKAAV